jgi:hypothetical protein
LKARHQELEEESKKIDA